MMAEIQLVNGNWTNSHLVDKNLVICRSQKSEEERSNIAVAA